MHFSSCTLIVFRRQITLTFKTSYMHRARSNHIYHHMGANYTEFNCILFFIYYLVYIRMLVAFAVCRTPNAYNVCARAAFARVQCDIFAFHAAGTQKCCWWCPLNNWVAKTRTLCLNVVGGGGSLNLTEWTSVIFYANHFECIIYIISHIQLDYFHIQLDFRKLVYWRQWGVLRA